MKKVVIVLSKEDALELLDIMDDQEEGYTAAENVAKELESALGLQHYAVQEYDAWTGCWFVIANIRKTKEDAHLYIKSLSTKYPKSQFLLSEVKS